MKREFPKERKKGREGRRERERKKSKEGRRKKKDKCRWPIRMGGSIQHH